MLFEKFIKHQKKLLVVFTSFLVASFGLGSAIFYFADPERKKSSAKIYGEEVRADRTGELQVRLNRVNSLLGIALGGRRFEGPWQVTGPFVEEWLLLLAACDENGLVVSEEEIADLKDQFYLAWFENAREADVEGDLSRESKVERGEELAHEYTKETQWEKAGWRWTEFDRTMAEWAVIRKFLSFMLEHAAKVSIDQVHEAYKGSHTVLGIRYVKIDADGARRRLEARHGREELERLALADYLEKHKDDDPSLRGTAEVEFVALAPEKDSVRTALDEARSEAGKEATEEELRRYFEANVDKYRDPDGRAFFEAMREIVRNDFVEERGDKKALARLLEVVRGALREFGTKPLPEIALAHGLELHRALVASPAEIKAALPDDLDAAALTRAVYQDLQPSEVKVLPGATGKPLKRPAFVLLKARRRVSGDVGLAEGGGGLSTARPKGIPRETVLAAFFEANPRREAYRGQGWVRIEAIVADREELLRRTLVPTREVERFWDRYKSRLFPGLESDPATELSGDAGPGSGPSLAEAWPRVERILASREVERRMTEDLDKLRGEFSGPEGRGRGSAAPEKDRSFETAALREGFRYLALDGATRQELAAHPLLGKVSGDLGSGFVESVFSSKVGEVSSSVYETPSARFFFRVQARREDPAPTWETVDRGKVLEELVREYAAGQSLSLMEEVYKTAKEETFEAAAKAHGLEAHESKRFEIESFKEDLPELAAAEKVKEIQDNEPGTFDRPFFEEELSTSFFVQLLEKDAPALDEMKPHEVRRLRAELRKKAIEAFEQKWLVASSVLLWGKERGIYEAGETKAPEE
ncbi:MAG: peptidyl-prolyl cis-trans isomerase [Planctomycetes bacterium]|nr:peptidyl-prolyl cis-trans isomerase [Planctomycetota bacterium]